MRLPFRQNWYSFLENKKDKKPLSYFNLKTLCITDRLIILKDFLINSFNKFVEGSLIYYFRLISPDTLENVITTSKGLPS